MNTIHHAQTNIEQTNGNGFFTDFNKATSTFGKVPTVINGGNKSKRRAPFNSIKQMPK